MKAKGEVKEVTELNSRSGNNIARPNDMSAYNKSLGTKLLKKGIYKPLHRMMYK